MNDPVTANPALDPSISLRIRRPLKRFDFATFLGLLFSFALIGGAIYIGQSNANFFNTPALMIVMLGTVAVTSISYTGEEIRRAGSIIGRSLLSHYQKPSVMAQQLIEIAVLVRKKGPLALSHADSQLRKDMFLHYASQMVTDGFDPQDVERVLEQEIDSLVERHKRSASIVRRASEIAPGMGLIGTLVGLVQMLAQLDDPSSIGPAMAVALLTTFYGAIMGTVVLSPLAAKLERNSTAETMIRTLILTAMVSIARQENPRQLEMLLNSILPPSERIRYFD